MSTENPNSLSIGHVYIADPADPLSKPVMIRYDEFVRGLFKVSGIGELSNKLDMMHAALGICGEAGELGDAIKKHCIYGKPLDRDNIVEELGDLRFYIQAVMNLVGITEQEILQTNGYKLYKRYKGGKYSDQAAIARADKVDGEGNVQE